MVLPHRTRLFKQQWNAIGLGATIRGRNGGTQYRLRLHVLCKIVKRGSRYIRCGGVNGIRVGTGEKTDLVGQLAALNGVDVRGKRLFVQPMRGTTQLVGSGTQAVAYGFVYLDPQSGCCHVPCPETKCDG